MLFDESSLKSSLQHEVESTLADEAFSPAEDVESKAQALDTPLVMLDSTMVVPAQDSTVFQGGSWCMGECF